MSDLIYLTVVLAFFGASVAYVHGCEKLRGGSHDWHGLALRRHGAAARLFALCAARTGEIL